MEMFSRELQELDRNTVQYMMDEMQEEIDQQKEEISQQKEKLDQKDRELEELRKRIRNWSRARTESQAKEKTRKVCAKAPECPGFFFWKELFLIKHS